MTRLLPVALVACLSLASSLLAAPVASKFTAGDPQIKNIDTITFASDGVLLISDGSTSRIVAVQTGDTRPVTSQVKVPNILAAIAGRLSTAEKNVEIAEIAVNPASKRLYVLVKKLDEKKNLLVTVDPAGQVAPVSLKSVPFATVTLPSSSAGSLKVSEMAWAGDRLVASARASEEFASKLLVIPAPLGPEAEGKVISAETYHVAHRKWETKAPMAAIFPYQQGGRTYIVGGFGCTPIVKYGVDSVTDGAKVKGESMLELGSGNRPLNMFAYTKAGKTSVIVNTFRFHHAKAPLSPNPYWTCRFDASILDAADKTNENAMRRNIKNPEDPAVTMVQSFHGVMHMDKLSDEHAVVIRDVNGVIALETLPLP